jgi:Rrf2 family protein
MKLSTKTTYGLRAMTYLVKNSKKPIALKEISQAEKIPFSYLEKIFGILEKQELIKSKKGPNGGYILARKNIKLSEVIAPLEGDVMKCISKGCVMQCKCQTYSVGLKIQEAVYKTLKNIRLSDLK